MSTPGDTKKLSTNSRLFGPPSPPVQKKNTGPQSQIKQCLIDDNTETDKKTPKKQINKEEVKLESPFPTRVRAPPGGFSSGLW